MAKYFVDFSGYCEVEANSAEEAREKFWNNLPKVGDANDNWEIEGVERVEGKYSPLNLDGWDKIFATVR